MFKIILNKIKELKYYSYDFFCSCKICKFLRFITGTKKEKKKFLKIFNIEKIKWLNLLSIYLKEKNLNIILRY